MSRYWTSDFFDKNLYTVFTVQSFNNLSYTEGLFILVGFIALAEVFNLVFKFLFKKLVGKTKTELDDKIVKVLRLPIFVSIVLVGVKIYLNSISTTPQIDKYAADILLTIVAILWSITGIRVSDVIIEEVKRRQIGAARFSDAIPFLRNITNISIFVIALLATLNIWGIDVTPLLASAGVAGVAIAFAAKDTVSNVFGGISIFFDKPYKVGDYVIIQEEYRGEVTQIGTRSTKVKTRDNVLITIPNSVMITQAVINETGFDSKLRIRIPVGVAYGSDLERVENITVEVLTKHKDVLDQPDPRVRYRNFGESAIELEAIAYISSPGDKGLVTHELIKEIDKAFKEEKISIPFPQMDVHLQKN